MGVWGYLDFGNGFKYVYFVISQLFPELVKNKTKQNTVRYHFSSPNGDNTQPLSPALQMLARSQPAHTWGSSSLLQAGGGVGSKEVRVPPLRR